jgi:hypothetical protein
MTTNDDETTLQPAVPDSVADQPAPAAPVATAPVVDLGRPSWLTRTVAVAGGIAAVTFVLGGVAGYAIGNGGGANGTRTFPAGFSRDGGHGLGGPGGGPGGGQGFNQQGPPNVQSAPGT